MGRKEQRKMVAKSYTYKEIVAALMDQEKTLKEKYNLRYTRCLATVLSTPPYNFGKKRVCDVVNMFMEQIEGLQLGTITEDQIEDTAAKVGVTCKYEDGLFVVDVNSTKNKEPSDKIKTVYIGGMTDGRRSIQQGHEERLQSSEGDLGGASCEN